MDSRSLLHISPGVEHNIKQGLRVKTSVESLLVFANCLIVLDDHSDE